MHSSQAHKRVLKHAAHPHPRRDAGDAFIKDPVGGRARAFAKDELAESLAERFVGTATAGVGEDDELLTEEIGGPFVTTKARNEFGKGADASNPRDAEPQAFPNVVAGLVRDVEDEDESEE